MTNAQRYVGGAREEKAAIVQIDNLPNSTYNSNNTELFIVTKRLAQMYLLGLNNNCITPHLFRSVVMLDVKE
jgi:hypothetical protein